MKKILSTILILASALITISIGISPMGVAGEDSNFYHVVYIDGDLAVIWTMGDRAYGYYRGHLMEGRYDVYKDKVVYLLREDDFIAQYGTDGMARLEVIVGKSGVAYNYQRYELKDGVWKRVEWKHRGDEVFDALDREIEQQQEKDTASISLNAVPQRTPIELIGNKKNCLTNLRWGENCGPIYVSFMRYRNGEVFGTGKNALLPSVEVVNGVWVRPVRFQPAVHIEGSAMKFGFVLWISEDEIKKAYAQKWHVDKNSLELKDLRIADVYVELGIDEYKDGSFVASWVGWMNKNVDRVEYFSPAEAGSWLWSGSPVIVGTLAVSGAIVGVQFPVVGAALEVASVLASVKVKDVKWEMISRGYASVMKVESGYWYKVFIYSPVKESFSNGDWARVDSIPKHKGFYPIYATLSTPDPGNKYAEIYGWVNIRGIVRGEGHDDRFDFDVPVRLIYKLDDILRAH